VVKWTDDFTKMFVLNVGVAGGGLEVGMAEKALDG